jgi:hypothetical protein
MYFMPTYSYASWEMRKKGDDWGGKAFSFLQKPFYFIRM